MKISIPIYIVLNLVISSCQTPFCDRLKKLENTTKLDYNENILDGFIVTDNVFPLNDQEFQNFYKRERSSSEKCYLVSKFSINEKRTGVISYVISYEGDKIVDYYDLNLIENCNVLKTYRIMISDSETMYYNVSSNIKSNFSVLTITEETSSEEINGKVDTLFTKKWKIDLRSPNLDTISKKKFFKILPSPPQK